MLLDDTQRVYPPPPPDNIVPLHLLSKLPLGPPPSMDPIFERGDFVFGVNAGRTNNGATGVGIEVTDAAGDVFEAIVESEWTYTSPYNDPAAQQPSSRAASTSSDERWCQRRCQAPRWLATFVHIPAHDRVPGIGPLVRVAVLSSEAMKWGRWRDGFHR